MRFQPILSAFFASALAACSGTSGLSDNRVQTGSQVMTTSSDFSALYVAHTDHGTVGRVPLGGGAIKNVEVGKRPTRVARSGDKVFVTLAGERKIVVLEEQGDALEEIARIDVGAEPYGVVASDDGARVYATVSLEDRVVEIDASSLEILRSWTVRGQPRWLALHPSGGALYVASLLEGRLTWIDLANDRQSELKIPVPQGFDQFRTPFDFSRRLTGDPAVSANGEVLAVPGLNVNNHDTVPEGDAVAPGDVPPDGKEPVPPPFPGGGGGYDSGRFTPVVALVTLDGDGVPTEDTIEVVGLQTFTDGPVVGYPSSVAIDPDSEIAVATIEGAGAAVAFSVTPPEQPGIFDGVSNAKAGVAIAPDAAPGIGGGGFVSFRMLTPYGVPTGPRAVVFAEASKPTVFGFIDRMIGKIDLETARAAIESQSNGSNEDIAFGGAAPRATDAQFPGQVLAPSFVNVASSKVEIVDEVLTPLEAKGRRLFFATNESKMSSSGSGVSCATCHFEGRNDGLTWTFARGARQTPSLAGKVSLNAPVRWEGDSPTVAHDAMRTSQGLMGGRGLTDEDTQAIEAFIDTNPFVDPPVALDSEAAQRGKAIFERADTACATCHSGARYTDKRKYSMKGIAQVQTRSLVGIAASAPYFHDGSAATLLDLVKASRDGSMGNTGMLSDAEMDDLVAYLKSL